MIINTLLLTAAPLFTVNVTGAVAELTAPGSASATLSCVTAKTDEPDMATLRWTSCTDANYALAIFQNSYAVRDRPELRRRSGILSFPSHPDQRGYIVSCDQAHGMPDDVADLTCTDQGLVPDGMNPNPSMGVSN